MRTAEVQVFQASELTGKAKERAREWFRQGEAQFFGAHGELFEPAETAAKLLGIRFDTREVPLMSGKTRTEPVIYWSGFSSQGDGASFEGRYEYAKGSQRAVKREFPKDEELQRIARELAGLQRNNSYKLSARITKNRSNYVHSNTIDAEVYKLDWRSGRDEFAGDDVSKQIEQLMRDFADWIYEGLREEYDYRLSDEAVDESMEANEYEFTAEGKRF